MADVSPNALYETLFKKKADRRSLYNALVDEWEPGQILPIQRNRITGDYDWAVPKAMTEMIEASMAPGKALRGEYGLSADSSGRVSYDGMAEDAAGLAGAVTLGAGAIPGQGLRMGANASRGRLPGSGSLNTPPAPSASDMKRLSRVERVPLSQARGTQPKMGWEKFEKGDHPGALIDGYGDMPIAVRREDGEYLIFDGHHRATKALNEGAADMPMYVIDAKDYAPSAAGKKPREQKWTESDEEMYRALLGDD